MPNHYLPWYAFHSDSLAFAAVLAWALSLLARDGNPPAVPRVAAVVLAVAALPWIQFASGLLGFAGEAWLASLYVGGFAASIHIGFQWARQPRSDEILLQTVVAATLFAGLVSTGLCLFQWLRLEDWLGIFIGNIGATGRPFANLAQPNLLATLLVMSVVSLAWTYESRRIGGWGLLCGAVFLTVGLTFTQSRAGYLSAVAVSAWWLLKQPAVSSPRLHRWAPLGWLLLLAICAALLPVVSTAFELAGDRPVPIFDNNGRWLMWKQIAAGIAQSPWIGYGWEHTPAAQMAGSLSYPGTLATAYAHNIALDAMAWLGVPLGLALVVAGLAWLWTRARQAHGQLSVYAYAVALPVLVHSAFEFPFAYAFFLLPAGIMLGVVEAGHPKAMTIRTPRPMLAGFVLALGLLGIQIAREYIPAEEDFRFLRFEALHMGNTPQSHTRPDFLVLSQIAALLDVGRITPAPGMTREQIERLRYVTVKYSWAPPAFLYAAALQANGRREEAAHQMQVIHDMYGKTYADGATARIDELRRQWRHSASAPP